MSNNSNWFISFTVLRLASIQKNCLFFQTWLLSLIHHQKCHEQDSSQASWYLGILGQWVWSSRFWGYSFGFWFILPGLILLSLIFHYMFSLLVYCLIENKRQERWLLIFHFQELFFKHHFLISDSSLNQIWKLVIIVCQKDGSFDRSWYAQSCYQC